MLSRSVSVRSCSEPNPLWAFAAQWQSIISWSTTGHEFESCGARYFFLHFFSVMCSLTCPSPRFNLCLPDLLTQFRSNWSSRSVQLVSVFLDGILFLQNNGTALCLVNFFKGRVAVIVDMLAKNKNEGERTIRQATKKIGGAFERGVINMFERKGLVMAKAPESGWPLCTLSFLFDVCML